MLYEYDGRSHTSSRDGDDTCTTMKDAVLVLDPVTEWREVLNAIKQLGMVALAGTCNPLEGREDMAKFIPDEATLLDAGFDTVLFNSFSSGDGLIFTGFDVYSAAQEIKLFERGNNIRVCGIIPLAETAVEYCDTVAALLGLKHNPLGTVLARRDKALMKETVANAGLRVCKFMRLKDPSEVPDAVSKLSLHYPIVIKTPQGFSTAHVHICENERIAMDRVEYILRSGASSPDCRTPAFALLEEYIGGEEIAVNMMSIGGDVQCTDIWLYRKSISEGTARYISADLLDRDDAKLHQIISYAKKVADALGIRYGAAHLELKSFYCEKSQAYTNPCMIEIGARLSGGRKATLSQAVTEGWHPFRALVESHCGRKVVFPTSFSPGGKHARHLFLPHLNSGKVVKIEGTERFESLSSYHSHFILTKAGDTVDRTTDITSCSGFVWLVGTRATVEADARAVWDTFAIHTEAPRESNTTKSDSSAGADGHCLGRVLAPSLWIGNLSSLRNIDMLQEDTESEKGEGGAEITVLTLLSSPMLKNFARDCVSKQREQLQTRKDVSIQHIVVDMKDDSDPGFISGPLPKAIEAIDKALGTNAESSTRKYCLVHCAKGESRSVTVVAAWLMLRKGFSMQTALAEVRKARPNANPNLAFIAALHAIEASENDLEKAAKRLSVE